MTDPKFHIPGKSVSGSFTSEVNKLSQILGSMQASLQVSEKNRRRDLSSLFCSAAAAGKTEGGSHAPLPAVSWSQSLRSKNLAFRVTFPMTGSIRQFCLGD